ncbi:unnamed protein product [Bemisia tabaci]|uniref:Ionotropic receptor n=1 Tax=Bemisia tabaci TaxID=7038 RepID=A0A9P0F8Z0_BEMTA|nr:unnamed protein product [Bemisia tabaci]
MIRTVFSTHHGLLKYSIVGNLPKNLIIFVNDLDEIPSLIIDSASNSGATIDRISNNASQNLPRSKHYCIRNELYEKALSNTEKTCDIELHISDAELDDEVVLTDVVFQHTKGLYANSVWNSNNYIIFMLPASFRGRNTSSTYMQYEGYRLKFLLKFFWRFFRGSRTIICCLQICYSYDPFMNRIEQIDATSEYYFIFSPNLDGHMFNVGYVNGEDVFTHSGDVGTGSMSVVSMVADDIQKECQCQIFMYTRYRNGRATEAYTDYIQDSQRTNLDMLIFDGTLAPSVDFTMFDFSTSFQSCSYCIATPHSDLVPPSFLPFKCFSPQTWAVILAVVSLFYGALYAFHRFQWTLFGRFYSDSERHAFEHTSVLLYLYSHLIVGRPPRLLLGRFITGKTLFLLVSLFVLIIVTVFQNKMTTLLATQVRYPEIESLEDLKDSDLFLQTSNTELSSDLLRDYPFYESLREKLSDGYFHYDGALHEYEKETIFDAMINGSRPLESPFSKKMVEVRSNLRSMLDSDAFMLTVSKDYRASGWVQAGETVAPGVFRDLHLVEECFLTYPMTLQVQKNSFISDLFVRKILAYTEMGIVQKVLAEMAYTWNMWFYDFYGKEGDFNALNSEVKAFTMQNLQPAFVSLILGWLLSGIIFVVELTVDILKGNTTSNFILRIEKLIRPSSLWA